MKRSTVIRLLGALLLVFNLWAIGRYDLPTLSAGLMTIGAVAAVELCLRIGKHEHDAGAFAAFGLVAALALTVAGLYVPPDNSDNRSAVIERRVFVCPMGYEPHAAQATQCALPWVNARLMGR